MAHTFACRDAGHSCGWKGSASTEDELVAKIAEHVKAKHDVKVPTQTIVNFVKTKFRST